MYKRQPPDRQEAVGKEIQADVKKYVDEAVPVVRDRAVKLAPSVVGSMLEEKFTEDELRQIVAVMESAAWNKFQQMGPELQKPLVEKLLAETRPVIEPKVKALEQSIARRLGITEPAAGRQPFRPVQDHQAGGHQVKIGSGAGFTRH